MNNPTLKGALAALALSLGISHGYAAETKHAKPPVDPISQPNVDTDPDLQP